jgi:hypothetical protein
MLSLFLNNGFYQDLASHLRLANDNYTALSTEYEHNTMDAPKKVVFSFYKSQPTHDAAICLRVITKRCSVQSRHNALSKSAAFP